MDANLSLAGVRSFAAATAALALLGAADSALGQISCFQDPVITHTNGMRLASSTPERSHNAYWQCDPGRIGYCNGRLYGPVKNDLHSLGTRHGCFPMPPGPQPGPVSGLTGHIPEGMEIGDAERLGTLRVMAGGGAPLSAAGPARVAPTVAAGETWADSIRQLGDKRNAAGASLP